MPISAAGHVGLLLATPPGFATAVWPASGIALGCVLLHGRKVLPGILLGSFAVNLTFSLQAGNAGLFDIAWTVPFLIAMGAALQAWAGAWLVRRYTEFPSALDELGVVLRTMALGGLDATVINASWSVTILHHNGVIPSGRWLQNWLIWCVGDSIGVLVFAPLVLV